MDTSKKDGEIMKFPCPFLHLPGAGITIQLRKKKGVENRWKKLRKYWKKP